VQVAEQLSLPRVGEAVGGVGAGGAIGGGATYLLGDCELGDLPKEGRFTLMSGLTASALPIAAPAAAGLLSIYFLASFPGGFEFRWGPTQVEPAWLTVFGHIQGTEAVVAGLSAAEVVQLPQSGLPTVTLTVNGVDMPALLDTGSPITVLNAAAAAATGLTPPGDNPLARIAAGLQAARSGSSGDHLMIASAIGQPVRLTKTAACEISIAGADFGQGTCRVYVGELPGLAALNGLGDRAGPAAVLGTDVLRQRPRLFYQSSKIFV
jgi:hypothetical protein